MGRKCGIRKSESITVFKMATPDGRLAVCHNCGADLYVGKMEKEKEVNMDEEKEKLVKEKLVTAGENVCIIREERSKVEEALQILGKTKEEWRERCIEDIREKLEDLKDSVNVDAYDTAYKIIQSIKEICRILELIC